MPTPERLPAPQFRLPDDSVATLDHVNNAEGQVTGTRTLMSGVTVKFRATLEDWDKIEKTRVETP
jgi:hypothetical protein